METVLSLSRAAFFSVVLTISLFILSSASFADTFTVTNTSDAGVGSLRDAIDMANANGNGPGVVDDIVFAFGVTGTILLDGQMTITDDVTISGPGAGVITIDAQTVDRIFLINDGLAPDIVVSISGLRFINGGGVSTGGAIENLEELSIDSCVFEDNGAVNNGGAIRNNGTINTITHSTFDGNSTFSTGGAIGNVSSATITEITHSTFDGNSAFNNGGAIHNFGTITAITNSTFRGNMASFDSGGAIGNFGTINISFTTIANNGAVDGGGIFNFTGSTLSIKNSIVAGNIAVFIGDNCRIFGGTFTPSGVNLSTDGSCPGFTTVTSAALNLDPAGLQDNGGPTQTIALISPSAAIDAIILADCTDVAMSDVTTDQRPFPRPFPLGGSCDVGAYEAQPTGKLTIEKETDPPGGMDFEFLGTGFPEGCNLMDTFFLGDTEMEMCILPGGMYTVDEIVPPGLLLDIMCDDGTLPDTFTGVTVDIADMDDVTCTFANLQAAEVKITKLTIPPGGTGFEFTSTGFEGFPPCDITPAFTLDNQQMASCLVLTDSFTITEAIPAGQVLNIFCEELPTTFNIDIGISMGTLGFTITDLNEGVDCLFINSPANTVVRVMDEPADGNCEFGGTKIETGLDANQNGILDPGEQIIDTSFVCNGEPGALVRVNPEPAGDNCAFGGQKIETGLDTNQNAMLDEMEITNTVFVCNGAPGVNTLVTVTPEPVGANCGFGGQRIDTGADDNMNGVLDPGEIENTFFVCSGATGPLGPGGPPGPPGEDGLDTVEDLNIEPAGENCPQGGLRFDSGLDLNMNGFLDPEEITQTSFVCNGENGNNNGCSGNTLAGAGSVDGMNTLAELFVLMILPFIVVLGRRFMKPEAIKNPTK